MKNKVFLGGTCADTPWRNELIPNLKVDYFNPVVEDWTPDCQEEERKQKSESNIHLYVITKEMTGVFSIAEAVDSSHIENVTTIFHVIPFGFEPSQLKSLEAVVDMVKANGGIAFVDNDLQRSARVINNAFQIK